MAFPLLQLLIWPIKRARKILAFSAGYVVVLSLYYLLTRSAGHHLFAPGRLKAMDAFSTFLGSAPMMETLRSLIRRVDCTDSFSFKNDTTRAHVQRYLTEAAIINRTMNCNAYFDTVQTFAFEKVTKAERDFPVSYGHLVNGQVGTFEMYLALHFRPSDAHCIHLDPKASETVHRAVEQLVGCYNRKFPHSTFFIAKHPVPVLWQDESVLRADLICLRQLMQRDNNWKIFLNLASSELPFMSHRKFREKLASANGSVIDVGPNGNADRQRKLMSVRR